MDSLGLELNEKTQIFPIRNGIDFLGFHTYLMAVSYTHLGGRCRIQHRAQDGWHRCRWYGNRFCPW